MKQKQIIALVSATALVATALAGCGKTSEENTQKTAVGEAEGTAKEDLPFSKYAETVTSIWAVHWIQMRRFLTE